MEHNESPAPVQNSSTEPDTSFGTLITNIFASPREAFDAVAGTDVKHMRWVLPLLISLIVMLGAMYITFSNPTFLQQIQDAQATRVQKMVDDGTLTQQQADAQLDAMSGNSSLIMIIGAFAGSIFIVLFYVLGALFLWLGAKFIMKADAPYGKYLEVYGLSSWIGIIGGIATLMIMIGMDTIYASASAGLLVLSDFDPENTTHKLLKSLDVFAIWQAVVAGIGLSAVAKKDNGMGIGVAMVLWIVWVAFSVLTGVAR